MIRAVFGPAALLVLFATSLSVSPLAAQSLPTGKWTAVEIAGEGTVDGVQSTLEIAEDGRASGNSGCNSYRGTAEFSITAISFGPLAGTRMACPQPAMDQEARFLQALEQVKAWKMEDQSKLSLLSAESKVIVRLSPQP